MIKLIACDIDGTLIPYGQTQLPQGLFPLVLRLQAAGIQFCPASGRQYHSLHQLFAPVAHVSCFLCENGAVVYGPGAEESAPILSKTPLDRAGALELAHAILDIPDCEVMLSGANTVYICREDPSYLHYLTHGLGNRVALLDRPEDMPEDIIKLSAYCPKGVQTAHDLLWPRWGEPFHMAVSGPQWLDFGLADKGTGITELCRALDIPLDQVAAFGDNWNDLPILSLVGRPYLMSFADPALKARFPRQCGSVLTALEDILKEAEG